MKVLMISNDFLPNPGGVANHIFELSKALVKQGHEVIVLHLCYSHITPQQEEISGVKIVRCWLAKNLADRVGHVAKLSRYILTVIKGSQAINRIIKQWQPDVIHWHDFYHTSLAMFLVRFSGKKILTNHASKYLEQYAKGGLVYSYLKFLAKQANAIIAPSQELADKSKILNKPVYYISNGVDIETFKPSTNKQSIRQYYKAENKFLLIAPRRLDPKNGLNYLIMALPIIKKTIPNVMLIIAGGGEESLKQNYLTLAKQLGVEEQLLITGSLSYSQMPQIIASADVVVIPSLMEAVSLAALEAMACAIPIVASDVGGLPLIIDEKVGKLAPPANPEALAQAIIAIQKLSMTEYQVRGNAARERVMQGYTWLQVADKTITVYKESKIA